MFQYYHFNHSMLSYIASVGPMIRALWSLEAAHATASDVFIFWIAIAAALKHLFDLPETITSIKLRVAKKITDIYNKRYSEFFNTDFYFTTFCLDPRMCQLLFGAVSFC
jgi:hypothetical protein